MKIDVRNIPFSEAHLCKADCLVALVDFDWLYTAPASTEQPAIHKPDWLIEQIKALPFNGQEIIKSKHLLISEAFTIKAKRLLLANTNRNNNLANCPPETASNIRQSLAHIADTICTQLSNVNAKHICVVAPFATDSAYTQALIDALLFASYRFNDFKTTAQNANPVSIKAITLGVEYNELAPNTELALAIHRGKSMTRDLANLPGNICTPSYFAQCAEALAATSPLLTTEVFDEATLTDMGMGAYVAVGQGSAQPTCMPVMHYRGALDPIKPGIVLIGKGITFDTGGITLKQPPGMQNMIYDMCGGATVMGIMTALTELRLPINVIGIIATAENMPDGNAFRPGDILTTLSGQTVEVISTDAEGRLVLCDAITYAQQFNPAAIIDIATLTGAHIVSLGSHASGLMSNSQLLSDALIAAGEQSSDRAWAMPIWDEYQEPLDSFAADMRNSGSNSPGMITAGCFLSRFAGNTPWAHLDIAGTSFQYGKGNSATSRPFSLLLAFLTQCSETREYRWPVSPVLY
ncbi:leucyl aminopeptidase [Alteromonas sp. AMM-1]|uniref:leucyl aminopeptidase n=1 Tax=Alteromonas sp. AMM-1 TaxID=3394233 RepID=UPI0039A60F9A